MKRSRRPPWKATCEREREWMIEWAIAEIVALDNQRQCDDVPQSVWENIPPPSRDMRLQAAKKRAPAHLVPLRGLYPEIAEFIHEPKRVRGQRRPYVKPMKGDTIAGTAASRLREWPSTSCGSCGRLSGESTTTGAGSGVATMDLRPKRSRASFVV